MNQKMESKEIEVKPTDVIVSATDPRGIITYANDIFVEISGYTRKELIGKPHNILRNKEMPKAIFKYLWQELLAGRSLYAFVKNQTKYGDYYWVKAYAIPVKKNGIIEKFISYRQPLNTYAKAVLTDLYASLVEYEKTHSVDASLEYFVNYLSERNLTYNDFIDRLTEQKELTNLEAMQVDYNKFYNEHIIYKSHIEHKIAVGEHNFEVEDSCSCNFGKWIDSVKHESYTKHSSWNKMIKTHNKYHDLLNEYVTKNDQDAKYADLEVILQELDENTKQIFASLQDTIDHCE